MDPWEYFCQTGKIKDYLAYKETMLQNTAMEQKRDVSDADHDGSIDITGTTSRRTGQIY